MYDKETYPNHRVYPQGERTTGMERRGEAVRRREKQKEGQRESRRKGKSGKGKERRARDKEKRGRRRRKKERRERQYLECCIIIENGNGRKERW